MGSKLGQGSYGTVYEENGSAVKVIKFNPKTISSLIREISILKALRGSKYCGYLEKIEFDDDMDVAKLYLPLGTASLYDRIYKDWKSDDEKIQTMKTIALGLLELHERDIIHLDLKPENIIQVNGVWKIFDFGISIFGMCSIDKTFKKLTTVTATYRPPEVFNKGLISNKVDIYSLGLIFLHIASEGRYIDKIYNTDPEKQFETINTVLQINHNRPIHSLNKDLFSDLIESMTSTNPDNRPDIAQVITHPFFGKMNISKPICSSIVLNDLFYEIPTIFLPMRILVTMASWIKDYGSRHASFFYLVSISYIYLALTGVEPDSSTCLTLTEAVNIDIIPHVLDNTVIDNLKLVLENDTNILIHTPYNLLLSIIGENDRAIELLYKVCIHRHKYYMTTDPKTLINHIIRYITEGIDDPNASYALLERIKTTYM